MGWTEKFRKGVETFMSSVCFCTKGSDIDIYLYNVLLFIIYYCITFVVTAVTAVTAHFFNPKFIFSSEKRKINILFGNTI